MENELVHQSASADHASPESEGGMSLSAPAFQLQAGPAFQLQNAPVMQRQVDLGGSVGDSGANNPADVRAVQDELHTLGFLNDANWQAERIAADAADAVAIADIPLTMAAISAWSSTALGRPLLTIEPDQITESSLNGGLNHAMGTVNVGGTVGQGGTNNPADVRAVQARLSTLGYLSAENLQAETPAEDVADPIPDASLPQTISAVTSFNNDNGTSLHFISVDSLQESLLNNPRQFSEERFALGGSAGRAGDNAPADVTALQNRLVALGYLSQANATAEAPAEGATDAIADADITQTISALESFQEVMGLDSNGLSGAGSDTHRLLMNPSLPAPGGVDIGGNVGRGQANAGADVRAIQDRLHDLGFLSTSNYLTERVDPAGGAVADADIPNTITSIENFQRNAVGRPDGWVGAGGKSERTLNDPSYGTMTTINPEATNQEADFELVINDNALQAILDAIEVIEGANSPGEIPATLTNGAGVPASYGAGQMIGATALGTLDNNADLAAHYNLDNAAITEMQDQARETRDHYNDTRALVPNATNQATLNAAIQTYITNHGAAFLTDTGLQEEDIRRMFNTHNIYRHIQALGVPRTNGNSGTVIPPAGQTANQYANTLTTQMMGDNDVTSSLDAVGMNRSSLKTYVRYIDAFGENRAAFQTKSIFSHESGQQVRNAMTDGNGGIAAYHIRDNYNSANGVVPANQPNRAEVIASIVAVMHNRGGSAQGWFNDYASVGGYPYVQNFLNAWNP